MRAQEFNGLKFHIGSNGYFYKTLGTKQREEFGKARESMHRYVWSYYNGEIPEGFIVHHKDGDKSNNDISNLELMEKSKHHSMHMIERVNKDKGKFLKQLEDARPLAKEWHRSKEGRDWHRDHYDNMKDKLHKTAEFTCTVCGKKYIGQDKKNAKYCSRNCNATARRKSGIDDIVAECEFCGEEFTKNKYSPKRFCGCSCSRKAQLAKR